MRFTAVLAVLDNGDDVREIDDLGVIPYTPGVPGLNESLYAAEQAVRVRWGAVRLTVMPADLPLATSALIEQSLRLAARYERAFIPDTSSRGTTLLFAGPDAALLPAYGPHSAHAHTQQGAHQMLTGGLDLLRHDVDDMADLFAANLRLEEGRERWEESA
jgi:2-phospho-L-lactate guanylyltransferase